MGSALAESRADRTRLPNCSMWVQSEGRKSERERERDRERGRGRGREGERERGREGERERGRETEREGEGERVISASNLFCVYK